MLQAPQILDHLISVIRPGLVPKTVSAETFDAITAGSRGAWESALAEQLQALPWGGWLTAAERARWVGVQVRRTTDNRAARIVSLGPGGASLMLRLLRRDDDFSGNTPDPEPVPAWGAEVKVVGTRWRLLELGQVKQLAEVFVAEVAATREDVDQLYLLDRFFLSLSPQVRGSAEGQEALRVLHLFGLQRAYLRAWGHGAVVAPHPDLGMLAPLLLLGDGQYFKGVVGRVPEDRTELLELRPPKSRQIATDLGRWVAAPPLEGDQALEQELLTARRRAATDPLPLLDSPGPVAAAWALVRASAAPPTQPPRARPPVDRPRTSPARPDAGTLDPEEARMGALLLRGRDEEEALWEAAVKRGTTVELARGLTADAARRAAIKNLAPNLHHYDGQVPDRSPASSPSAAVVLTEQRVRVAADSIAQLRATDVDRVLRETPDAQRSTVASVLVDQRPELSIAIREALADLAGPAPPTPLPEAPAPAWEPATLEQRDGRVVRHGSVEDEVLAAQEARRQVAADLTRLRFQDHDDDEAVAPALPEAAATTQEPATQEPTRPPRIDIGVYEDLTPGKWPTVADVYRAALPGAVLPWHGSEGLSSVANLEREAWLAELLERGDFDTEARYAGGTALRFLAASDEERARYSPHHTFSYGRRRPEVVLAASEAGFKVSPDQLRLAVRSLESDALRRGEPLPVRPLPKLVATLQKLRELAKAPKPKKPPKRKKAPAKKAPVAAAAPKPPAKPPAQPSFILPMLAFFATDVPYHLEVLRHRDVGGEVFYTLGVVPNGAGEMVASVEVSADSDPEFTWLTRSVREGERERVERAAADARARARAPLADEDDDEDEDNPAPRTALGVQVALVEARTRHLRERAPPQEPGDATVRKALADLLRRLDLPERLKGQASSPRAVAGRLGDDGWGVYRKLWDYFVKPTLPLEEFMEEIAAYIQTENEHRLETVVLTSSGSRVRIHEDAVFDVRQRAGRPYVVVTDGLRRPLRRVDLEIADDTDAFYVESDELRAGDRVYTQATEQGLVGRLHENVQDLELWLRHAPPLLDDARRGLQLAGALMATWACRGPERGALLAMLSEAIDAHDTALSILHLTPESFDRARQNLEQVVPRVLAQAQSCAEGQQALAFAPARPRSREQEHVDRLLQELGRAFVVRPGSAGASSWPRQVDLLSNGSGHFAAVPRETLLAHLPVYFFEGAELVEPSLGKNSLDVRPLQKYLEGRHELIDQGRPLSAALLAEVTSAYQRAYAKGRT